MPHFSCLKDEVYDNAKQFLPERWENDPTGGVKAPGIIHNPFGTGYYKCFGQPLAMYAIRSMFAVATSRPQGSFVQSLIHRFSMHFPMQMLSLP